MTTLNMIQGLAEYGVAIGGAAATVAGTVQSKLHVALEAAMDNPAGAVAVAVALVFVVLVFRTRGYRS